MTSQKFRNLVYRHYEKHGRHALPWRKTTDPYRILVSEIMLQQTQVDRVALYFERFIKAFPTIQKLAKAPLGDVLRLWQGLGYNRRAKMLHECAKVVVTEYKGKMPQTHEELVYLPGIGPYTAAAVLTFSYNKPIALIETNVRAAFIHHFFPMRDKVHDSELLPLVEKALDQKNPRKWYSALMDYGSYLKRTTGNASRRSAHHVRQSKFQGSDRQVRGAILRALAKDQMKISTLIQQTGHSRVRINAQLKALIREEMVVQKKGAYSLP